MKKLLAVAAVWLVIGCGSHDPNEVVMVEKTKTYHREECRQVMMAKTETVPRAEAVKDGCKPCPYCKPDSTK